MKKKDNHWFAHDKNAMNQPALMSLKAVYGMKGYGIWWALMETLRSNEGYRYNIKEEFAYVHLSKLLEEMNPEEVRVFIDDCIHRFKLLKLKNGYIYQEEMTEQLRALDRKRKTMSEGGKKSAEARKRNVLTDNELCNPLESTLQLPCNKERKEEESIEKNTTAKDSTPTEVAKVFVVDDGGNFKSVNTSTHNTQALHTQETHYTLEQLCARSMADIDFNLATTGIKRITEAQLFDWLTAFNKWLRYTAETHKTDTEYRKHFRSWLGYHDTATENPTTYNPAADTKPLRGRRVLPSPPSGTPIEEALRLQREETERALRRLRSTDDGEQYKASA